MNVSPGIREQTSATLKLEPASEALYAELETLEGVGLFHRRPWHRVLERALGWPVQAATLRDADGTLRAMLPLVAKRRLGRRLHVCLPLTHLVGPALGPGVAAEALDLRGVAWPLEVHAPLPLAATGEMRAHVRTVLDLRDVADADALFRRLHPSTIRRRIRKAARHGVTVEARSDAAAFEAFARLQTLTRRRQGAPDYPAAFFPALAEELGNRGLARVHLAMRDGRPVAGVVFLADGGRAVYGYGASLPARDVLALGVNQAAMWDALRRAFEDGRDRVDFGSTPRHQTPLRIYKERFGGVTEDLVWRVGGDDAAGIDQGGLGVRLVGAGLRRLPLPLFRAVSPGLLKAVL